MRVPDHVAVRNTGPEALQRDLSMITCCVLAWNEVASLRAVVDDLRSGLRSLRVPHDILVIDDGSTDGTSELADALAEEHPDVRVIHHGVNRGLGAAYRTGFEQGRGTYLTFFPADGQFPADLLTRFFPLIERYDLVLGNLPSRNDSLKGRLLTRAERLLYRVLFGSVPRLEGMLMVRRSILGAIPLKSQGRGHANVWELVIRATRAGYRHTGVPIEVRPRMAGTSKVNNLRTVVANLVQVARLRKLL
jgi:glycosyltransferase involved in cell wall biosynthesis